ncbi:OstA-like protein [Prevotella sp. 10(H)]|uniref:OstA-like protein n=1 Tax=Prevotella sp. 10(H) TaxID=1158294 RepID=UPI0009E088A7|nr:OstA-like protein [Prevotella sp. 10(H)]
MKHRHRIPLASVLCLIALYASAQALTSPQLAPDILQVPQKPQDTVGPRPATAGKGGGIKVIELVNSKRLIRRQNFEPQVLKDSVIFFHDGAFLYCDSAYYDERQNSFEAFSNVRMEQGDTLFLNGRYMHYDGNTRLVKVRENVNLEHSPKDKRNPITLFTDSLNYDRGLNMGYYFDGGMLVDSLNELTSYWGQYEPNIRIATFKDSVILKNPNFTLYSDRLKYDTNKKIAIFTTPTRIVSDSGLINTSNGWYNTDTEESLLLDQSTIINNQGNQYLRGDSIFYHKTLGYGEVFGNMFLQDTIKKTILIGNYGYYNELNNSAMATDSAYCIEYSQGDSLYIHADTLRLITIIDSTHLQKPLQLEPKIPVEADSLIIAAPQPDSLALDTMHIIDRFQIDSARVKMGLPADTMPLYKSTPPALAKDSLYKEYRLIKAYYGVRFYRSDMQGVCDSLQFNSKDSIIHMYRDPILWNTNRQLSGDTIDIFLNDSTIEMMHVKQYSFSIEEKDSIHFNQLKSRSLKVFFENKKAKRVLAEGNVETITYPEERGGTLNGVMNWLESSYLEIFMNDGQFEKLVAWPKPVGTATPFHLITPDKLRLKDFYWYDYIRPLDKDDIFREVTKKATDVRPKRPAVFDREIE